MAFLNECLKYVYYLNGSVFTVVRSFWSLPRSLCPGGASEATSLQIEEHRDQVGPGTAKWLKKRCSTYPASGTHD